VPPEPRLPRYPRARGQGGFTLIEIAVAMTIAALLLQIVMMNMGAMVPSHAMDSAAAQIVAQMDFLRSEARLQGKTYVLELDLDNHRYRTILPPEDRLVASEPVKEAFALNWTGLGDDARFGGCTLAGGQSFRSGLYPITFDANGFTADQAIYLIHNTDAQMVWTIQVYGLTGKANILPSMKGEYQPLEKVEEGAF